MTDVELSALKISCRVAFCSTLCVMPVAVWLGYILARQKAQKRVLLEFFLALPLVLPPVAVGYGLLLLFGVNGVVGKILHEHLGIRISFTFYGAVIAAAIVSLPLATRSVRIAIEALPREFEDAAISLGATSRSVFWRVILPMARPGVLSGAVLAFIRSVGEFGATMVLAGNIEGETRTLALSLWTALQQPEGENTAMRLLLLTTLLSVAALLISEHLSQSSKEP